MEANSSCLTHHVCMGYKNLSVSRYASSFYALSDRRLNHQNWQLIFQRTLNENPIKNRGWDALLPRLFMHKVDAMAKTDWMAQSHFCPSNQSVCLFHFHIYAVSNLVHGEPDSDGIASFVKADVSQRSFNILCCKGFFNGVIIC